jgi:hypothetical protein
MDDEVQPTPAATLLETVFDTAVFLVFIPIVAVTIGVVSILNARDARRAAAQRPISTRLDNVDTTAPVSLPTHCDQDIVFPGRVVSDAG